MDLLTEKQVSEMIVEYEGRVKDLIEKIKGELQNRKELKKKIEEAKQREELQLKILERMEESEKMVRKQLELVTKMEDHESLKMREIIKKYEQMLEEQKEVWKKYKEQYESLPLVKEVRKAETRYLNATIKYRMTLQKMKETRRKVQLRNTVRKRLEQLQIIRFAEMYVEYMKKQKRCQELWDQNKKLTAQAQQLRREREEKEKAKQQKLDAELQKASALMKPQQLPQVDMSRYIIQRNKGHDKLDTMSINSYILEEEYINNNGQSNQKSNGIKAMEIDNEDAVLMDIDTQEDRDSREHELVRSSEPPRKLDFNGVLNNEGKTQCTLPVDERNNDEMQNHMQTDSSDQSRTQVGEHNRALGQQVDSQESQSSRSGNKNSTRKRTNEMQQQDKENASSNESSGQLQNESLISYERPIPSTVKMSKSSFQEKHPHQQSSHVSRRALYDSQQRNQLQQFSKRSSQDTMESQQSSRRSSQETMLPQHSSRHSSQEIYHQQQHQLPRNPSQEVYQQQQQQSREVYQQQQVSREVYQQQQQSREAYQQSQQQQTPSRHPSPQKIYQQHNQHEQEMYLRSEQRLTSHEQLQASQQKSEQIDFSRLPSNKPKIISNEYANYDLPVFDRKQHVSHFQPKAESTLRMTAETPTISRNASIMAKTESTTFAQQVPFPFVAQSSVNVTPLSAVIEPSSMMSTSIYSGDINYLPDNISYYLGSEITESGGSMELARRLHDADLISEDGDFDIYKMTRTACSPMVNISPRVLHPTATENSSTQPPANNSANENPKNSNPQVFNLIGEFRKKTPNPIQRLF